MIDLMRPLDNGSAASFEDEMLREEVLRRLVRDEPNAPACPWDQFKPARDLA